MNDDRPTHEGHRPHHRSAFWPIVLIGVGVFWLLSNMGYLSAGSLWILLRLWPLVLIAIGLDLLVGRRWPALSALVGLAVVGVIVVFLLYGARMGLEPAERPTLFGAPIVIGSGAGAELTTEHYSEPLGSATSARVSLQLHEGMSTISALGSSSNDLIDADVTYYANAADFQVAGDEARTVTLRPRGMARVGLWWPGVPGRELPWTVRLSPRIPLELGIDGGSGKADANLAQLTLTRLAVRGGSGSLSMALPEGEGEYPAEIAGGSGSLSLDVPRGPEVQMRLRGGSGSCRMTIADGAQANLVIDGGSGSVNIDLPANYPVRVEIQRKGSGSINLPRGLQEVRRTADGRGLWQSQDFEQASFRITFVLSGGSGSISLR